MLQTYKVIQVNLTKETKPHTIREHLRDYDKAIAIAERRNQVLRDTMRDDLYQAIVVEERKHEQT